MKKNFILKGIDLIAGVDEVGGPAGPVVAAAIILPKAVRFRAQRW